MSAIEIASAILGADAGVKAVTTSIFPLVKPESAALPVLVVHLVKEDDEAYLQGANGYPVATVIIDAVAASFGGASTLGDKVKAALTNYRGTIAGADVSYILPAGVDHFDRGDQGAVWRRRLSFDMRYRVAGVA